MKDPTSSVVSLAFSLLFLSLISGYGQKTNSVQWTFAGEPVRQNESILKITADISPGWHLYSQTIGEGGPRPTRIFFEETNEFVLVGSAEEKGDPTKLRDETYEMEIIWYSGTVTFLQKIRLNQPVTFIKGRVEYMTCNNYVCIPDKQDFIFNLQPPK